MKINNTDHKIRILACLFLFVFSPSLSYGNPILLGMYGRAGIEPFLIIPTIIIEYLIILILLKPKNYYRLFGAVIRIHLITYPLTVITGVFASFFAEVIPLVLEPAYFKRLFEKYQKKGLLSTRPDDKKIWKTVIIANLVTFVMGLLITFYLQYDGYFNISRDRSIARTHIEVMSDALSKYDEDVGKYPSTAEGLNALIYNPGENNWKGPYLKKLSIPKDPWHNPYQYQSPGAHGAFDLYSYGRDKAIGGEGHGKDITNWDK